jgi:hypothetical protein
MADQIFPSYNRKWELTTLSVSFRLTNENAQFINECVFDHKRIYTVKSGIKPDYYICDSYSKLPYQLIMDYKKTYANEDIFILAPTVKSEKSPIRLLANKLSEKGIPVYVPNNDEEKLDDDILAGKIVFSTFHQTKGLERKVVLIFNFDESYFKFFKKQAITSVCPNEIYVALTRAINHISLIHHYDQSHIPFLKVNKLYKFANVHNMTRLTNGKCQTINKALIETSVTDITRHLSIPIITKALEYLTITEITPPEYNISIPTKTEQAGLWEAVSEITGTAIPAYFELLNTGIMKIYETIKHSLINPINMQTLTTNQLLYIANKYCSHISGYN